MDYCFFSSNERYDDLSPQLASSLFNIVAHFKIKITIDTVINPQLLLAFPLVEIPSPYNIYKSLIIDLIITISYLTASPSLCLLTGEFHLPGVSLSFLSSPSLLASWPTLPLQVKQCLNHFQLSKDFCLQYPITGGQGGGKHLRTSFIPSARWYLLQPADFCQIIDNVEPDSQMSN